MSFKKLSLLTISFMTFIIVLTAIFKLYGYNNQTVILSLSNSYDYLGTVKSYNYVDITENSSIYVGKMTAYGADCKGCSGSGGLSCRAKDGSRYTLTENGMYYEDDEYGSVRIVAASLDGFPCGTIVKVDNGKLQPFYAVVMDTGGSVTKAWKNGIVWMDLAFVTEKDSNIYKANSSNVIYEIQRWGW